MIVAEHPRISIDPEICFGKPTVRGTRMRVCDVLGLLAAGESHAAIIADYPYVSVEDITACLAFAAEELSRPVDFVAR